MSALRKLIDAASPRPWNGCHIVNEDGSLMSRDEMAAYAKKCVDAGVQPHFYAAQIQDVDRRADVAHFGNGPHSERNLDLAVTLANSADEIEALVEAVGGILPFAALLPEELGASTNARLALKAAHAALLAKLGGT